MASSKPKTKKPLRAPKADTAAGLLKAMVDASKGILQPLPYTRLRPKAKRFWTGIITARARDEWDDVSLAVAAQLAECQCAIEEVSVQVRKEGTVLETSRGPRVNPRVKVLEDLCRREMAMMRTLRFGGRISGDLRHDMVKRQVEKDAREVLESLQDDELLA